MRTTLLCLSLAAAISLASCSGQQTPASGSQDAAVQPATSQPAAGEPAAPGAAGQATAQPATSAAAQAPAGPPPPTYREVTLPAGTDLPIQLMTSLASDTSRAEEAIRAQVRRDVVRDDLVVIPVGTRVNGVVTDAQRSGKVKGVARLAFRFTSMTIDDEQLDFSSAAVARAAKTTKRKDATKVGIGAGAGALIGGVLGGGKGAAIGAGVGAGAGTGAVVATRGDEVRLAAGTSLTITLTEPLTVRVLLHP
jgi:hypothetical protein